MTPLEIRLKVGNLLASQPSDEVRHICKELLDRLPQPYVGRYGRVCPECKFKMRGLRTCECPNCGHQMRGKMTYGDHSREDTLMGDNDCRSCGSDCSIGHHRGAGVCLPCNCMYHSQCLRVFVEKGFRSCPEHRHVKIPERFLA